MQPFQGCCHFARVPRVASFLGNPGLNDFNPFGVWTNPFAHSTLAGIPFNPDNVRMSQKQPAKVGLKKRPFPANDVFLMLHDPFRRRVIRSLANGEMKTASELGGGTGLSRQAFAKHLQLMCDTGFIVKKENRSDARKPIFGLAPAVVVCKTEDSTMVNLGCAKLRLER